MATRPPAKKGAQPQQAQARPVQTQALRYLRTQPIPTITGTIPATAAGGTAASQVTWNPATVPEIPAWASAIDLSIELPIALTVPAKGSVKVSPWAPYSAIQLQAILSGSPEWPNNTSLVPFWLDHLTSTIKSNEMSYGPDDILVAAIPTWFYGGPQAPSFTGVYPGSTIANTTTTPVVHTFTWKFTCRIRLQVKPKKLWGCIPLGDPQNRPRFPTYLTGLVGPNPENNPFYGAGATAKLHAKATINMTLRALSLDILPNTVPALPAMRVGMGRQVSYTNSLPVPNAGSILYQQQRVAQIYTSIFHCLVNAKEPVNPDYIGLWLTQTKQSARWTYDSQTTTLQNYYKALVRERYGKYLPTGVVAFDLDFGTFPDIPRETPYNALMSPDVAYAAQAGVKVTPNMSTAFRIPSGTTMTGAYSATYSFGLIRVPY